VGIANLDGSLSNDESDLTRNVCDVTAFIRGLQAKDLTAVDRAALRSLLDELESFVRLEAGAVTGCQHFALEDREVQLSPHHNVSSGSIWLDLVQPTRMHRCMRFDQARLARLNSCPAPPPRCDEPLSTIQNRRRPSGTAPGA